MLHVALHSLSWKQGWNSFHLCANITPTTNLERAIWVEGCELELALKCFFYEGFRSKQDLMRVLGANKI